MATIPETPSESQQIKLRCPVCDSWDYPKKYDQCFNCAKWFANFKSDLYATNKQLWMKARKLGLL